MDIESAFESKYLKAADLQNRQHTVVIDRIEIETMQNRSGDEERKPVVYFQGKKKGLVLNRTNAKSIQSQYGRHTEHWIGKPLTLFMVMTDAWGETVEAIRCRVPQQTSPAGPASSVNPPPPATPPPTVPPPVTYSELSPPPRDFVDDDIPF